MSNKLVLNLDKLAEVNKLIKSLSNDYEGIYKELYNDIRKMQGWTGVDSSAYIEQINGFEDDFQKMKTLMDAYANFLDTAEKSFRETQQSILEDIKKLSN